MAAILAVPALACLLTLAAPTPPPRPPLAAVLALPVGALAGLILFATLAGRRRRLALLPLSLLPFAIALAAAEEVVWRGFLLARVAARAGPVAGLLVAAAAFAAAHYPVQRGRGVLVQFVTGSVFGGVFAATGSVGSAAAAHAVYNALALGGGAPAAAAIDAHALRKRYGRVEALRDVDLRVDAGEVVVLLGPNGAGKTTLIEILLGLRRPDGGSVRVVGRSPGSRAARAVVSAAPQELSFPPTLRVREILDFVLAHDRRGAARGELLERFGLGPVASRQVGGLSGGNRRRLALAVAFARAPRLALLDEPTSGLDVESRRRLWESIRASADGGRSVVLTTHDLWEAEALADRLVVLHAGRVVADGPTRTLRGPGGGSLEDAYLRLTRVPGCVAVVGRPKVDP